MDNKMSNDENLDPCCAISNTKKCRMEFRYYTEMV